MRLIVLTHYAERCWELYESKLRLMSAHVRVVGKTSYDSKRLHKYGKWPLLSLYYIILYMVSSSKNVDCGKGVSNNMTTLSVMRLSPHRAISRHSAAFVNGVELQMNVDSWRTLLLLLLSQAICTPLGFSRDNALAVVAIALVCPRCLSNYTKLSLPSSTLWYIFTTCCCCCPH